MSIVFEAIYRFNAYPIKIPVRLFVNIEIILKFIWKGKGARTAQIILQTFGEKKIGENL